MCRKTCEEIDVLPFLCSCPDNLKKQKKGREVKKQETVGFEKLQSKTRLRSQAVNVGLNLYCLLLT